MSLPTPSLGDVSGLSRYPKTPQISNLDDGRGNFTGGQRIDSVTYRIDTEGHYTLPADRGEMVGRQQPANPHRARCLP